jgi:hypothetical protein
MKTMEYFMACGACNRVGNGNDPDKCACGWQVIKVDSRGCFLGAPIVGPIKPRKKLTRSQERYRRYMSVADCFETFHEFSIYEAQDKINREEA